MRRIYFLDLYEYDKNQEYIKEKLKPIKTADILIGKNFCLCGE